MRVPVEWLNEYVKLEAPVEEVADLLTMAGLEVEEIDHLTAVEVARLGGVPDAKDDRILMTKVTPNRGDWLSMLGVAREISAVTGWKLKTPKPIAKGTAPATESLIKISITAPDLCPRYAGIVIRNVVIKESPDWLKNRLIRAGMRPINNIVDITNYVMLEYGQPLHAFDYDLLTGKEIIVRRAREGETITTIDEIERKLSADTLVIADSNRAVAVAGVMGGSESEVGPNTKNIMLESANFNAVSIRRTSKLLSLVTESSYRFERGVDPGITDEAAKRAAELMQELADGEISQGIVDVFPGKSEPRVIFVRPERVNWLLGTNLDVKKMTACLEALQFSTKLAGGGIEVTVPTFRPDVEQEVDVIEEIARIYGYENLGVTLPSAAVEGKDSREGLFTQRLRGILMACGMQEVLTHSLIDPQSVQISGLLEESLAIRNPLSEDTSRLRTALAPNLLHVISRNRSVGQKDISIFEIGKVYHWLEVGAPTEHRSLAVAMTGSQWSCAWNLDKDALNADFYLAKGALERIFDCLHVSGVVFEPIQHPMLHPTRAARVVVNGIELGVLGEVSSEVLDKLDIRGRVYVFEIDVDRLMILTPEAVGYKPLPRFPAVYRHLAVVVKQEVPYAEVKRLVVESGGEIIEDVELLDVYTGTQIKEDERNLTLSIIFRSSERTLTDEEVAGVLEAIKASLVKEFGVTFRG